MRLLTQLVSCVLFLLALTCASATSHAATPPRPEPGLLFYLSGDNATMPDFSAAGTQEPNFLEEITLIKDGARGPALSCGNLQLLSYRAPGNIFAQRGTLSFFWRSREPVGPTEFPIFRVGYADHSSWDMVWLRIDYNGHGFDAFVTDTGLARLRVSATLEPFPKPNEWIHLALAWDENTGMRFYVNGHLAGSVAQRTFLDAGLDQFGPHSRIISPYQVQSDYNFVRGGDLDELRIYDRALSDDEVARLVRFETPLNLQPFPVPTLSYDTPLPPGWATRFGWNRSDAPPPTLPATYTSVRKVEITDAYDLKRWWWKATDGIRETTWPGVYNRSRLTGRNDYFQLPDWDCYVESGKSISFNIPAGEAINHLEIAGPAFGAFDLIGTEGKHSEAVHLFERPRGQEKTVHRLATPVSTGALRFTNIEQETPIEELSAYHVAEGKEPAGRPTLAYRIGGRPPAEASLKPLVHFIAGRHPIDERAIGVAVPATEPIPPSPVPPMPGQPLLHVLIPVAPSDPAYNLDKTDAALDGIALDMPVVGFGKPVSFNVRVKDPLWPARDMLDFTYTVQPGTPPPTLWLDLRDRWLPRSRALYFTIAASEPIQPNGLAPLIRLVFKPKEAARAEHELDRFTQARDCYAMIVEEHPASEKHALFNRYTGDLKDLHRINPNHVPGLFYYNLSIAKNVPSPKRPAPPAGVPLWAARQVELLKRVDTFVNWWIDHRQVPYGDFGGGISDDTDLTNVWPGLALMGCQPEKLRASVRALLDAAYKNGMFTHGLSTLQTDYLHSYEEGINCLAQNLLLDHGNPWLLERAFETARGVNALTDINPAGHRHIRSLYFSGTKIAEDGVWGGTHGYSHLVLQPGQMLVDYNGSPVNRQTGIELADGLLAHRYQDAEGKWTLPSIIYFASDKNASHTRNFFPWHVFWTAYQWTGEKRYLTPILDGGMNTFGFINPNALDLLGLRKDWAQRILERASASGSARTPELRGSSALHFAWQVTGDKKHLEDLYAKQLDFCEALEYINTEGSLWSDRVAVPTAELQRARLGGVALVRNSVYPGHAISWRFTAPATDKSVAILVPFSTPRHLTIIVFNLDEKPVTASMTGWAIDPGTWEISQGIDTNNDDKADGPATTRTARFERSHSLNFTFAPRATTVLALNLKEPGTPYWQRPDLGISCEDISLSDREIRVRLHSLGSVNAPPATITLRDATGKTLATARSKPLAAPLDLQPKTDEVTLSLPDGFSSAAGCTVEINADQEFEEITRLNNRVRLPAK